MDQYEDDAVKIQIPDHFGDGEQAGREWAMDNPVNATAAEWANAIAQQPDSFIRGFLIGAAEVANVTYGTNENNNDEATGTV